MIVRVSYFGAVSAGLAAIDILTLHRVLSLYKGVVPPLLAETPKRATKVKQLVEKGCVVLTKKGQISIFL